MESHTKTRSDLRAMARLATMFAPTTLPRAIARLGFVQADPIRVPARAQDLILRHRVSGYRAGDLERRFARLGLEEDFLYAYGFMPREISHLLHRLHEVAPGGLAAEVLAFVRDNGPTHPAALEARFGRDLTENYWGGQSKATTRALDALQRDGHLRVAGRKSGVRVYEAVSARDAVLAPEERARELMVLVARIMAPAPRVSLGRALALVAWRNKGLGRLRDLAAAGLRDGTLASATLDGETFVWPADMVIEGAVTRDVRLLAPFDPVVWDRRRFELLWGWPYRFEAYTPAPQRQFGYYAMPLLWGDAVIGWANVSVKAGKLDVTTGFPGRAPGSQAYRRAFDAECARMERFLGLSREVT